MYVHPNVTMSEKCKWQTIEYRLKRFLPIQAAKDLRKIQSHQVLGQLRTYTELFHVNHLIKRVTHTRKKDWKMVTSNIPVTRGTFWCTDQYDFPAIEYLWWAPSNEWLRSCSRFPCWRMLRRNSCLQWIYFKNPHVKMYPCDTYLRNRLSFSNS